MTRQAPVAVFIPTYHRGTKVFETLRRIQACDPLPAEIWIHIDRTDGRLEADLAKEHPAVQVISSTDHVGPGGGRHRCLQRCTAPVAVSFDDDSYPCDPDFFGRVAALFEAHPDAGVIGAMIWHPHQSARLRTTAFTRQASFTGCGHAIRLRAYRALPGYVPRPVAYGLEESDLSLQLFAQQWAIYESGELRVFHDTALSHHHKPETTECVVANVAVLAFLRYPVWLWAWGALQLSNTIRYCLSVGRWRGVLRGLARIPADCFKLRCFRQVQPSQAVRGYLKLRRSPSA